MNIVALDVLIHHFQWSHEYRFPLDPDPSTPLNSKPYKTPLIIRDAYDFLTAEGLIEIVNDGARFRTTPCGKCHIDALLNAPLPEQSWTSPIARKA